MWPGPGHGVFTSGFGSGGGFGTSTTSCDAAVDVCDVVEPTVAQPNEQSERQRAMERVMFMARDQVHGARHAFAKARASMVATLRGMVRPRTGVHTPAYWGK